MPNVLNNPCREIIRDLAAFLSTYPHPPLLHPPSYRRGSAWKSGWNFNKLRPVYERVVCSRKTYKKLTKVMSFPSFATLRSSISSFVEKIPTSGTLLCSTNVLESYTSAPRDNSILINFFTKHSCNLRVFLHDHLFPD